MEEEANIMLEKTGPMGHFHPHEILRMPFCGLKKKRAGIPHPPDLYPHEPLVRQYAQYDDDHQRQQQHRLVPGEGDSPAFSIRWHRGLNPRG
jgi:hypothetical protein